jgi:hypothetical protein
MRCRRLPPAIALLVRAAIAGVLVSCRPDTGPREDASRCPAADGEFALFGCTAIAGQVFGSRGQPLGAVSVGFLYALDGGGFAGNYVVSEPDGRFFLRPVRIAPPGPGATSDSVSFWIRATVVPQLPQMVATVLDSALVRARVAPNGAVPDTAHVTITLAWP